MKRLIQIVSIFFIFIQSHGQYSTLGTDFWVSWMQNFDSPENCILYITSGVGATGTVSMPGTGWTQNFTVGANGAITITVPTAQNPCIATANTVLNRGVRVVSNNPIAVFTVNQRIASTDATLVLPVSALGDEYYVTAYSVLSGQPSQFVVVGIENNTSIQITPKTAVIGGVGANVPFNITLNAGQVYLVQSNGDLTGSVVKATTSNNCNNFAVFSGNRCANVPTTCTYCDHLFEQMIPLKAWGNNYATAPLMARNGDQFRILASENATTININGGAGINLNAGQFHEVMLTQASYITSNKPISVAQYSRGQSCDGASSDPFMIILSPVEQFIDHIVFFSFLAGNVTTLATNIITKTANTGLATLDGAAIPGWATIPSNPTYSFARRIVTQGSHTLHSDSGVVAIVYGYGNVESYGYLAGANVQPLNVGFSIIVDNDTIPYDVFHDTLNCNQQTVSFMTDPNAPITDISWDFDDGTTGLNSPITHTFPGAGTYYVTLYYMRLGSCILDSLVLPVTINSTLPSLTLPNDTVFCSATATFVLDATTIGASTYLWHDNSTNPTYTVVHPGGTYSVTVTDPQNCSITGSVDVQYIDLQLTGSQTNVTCMGLTDGSATVNASGGNTPYTYSWSTTPVQTTATASNLTSGTYTVTVTENNGCTATTSFTITEAGLLNLITDSTAVSCFGYSDGSASVTVSGGVSPYTYEWNGNQTLNTSGLTGATAGTQTVIVTDSNGCAASVSITINSPDLLVASIDFVSPAACASVPGQMTSSAIGGTPPYSYLWSTTPAQTGATATNLPAGTYTVTITDDNGCSSIASAEYTTIDVSFLHTPEYCDQGNGTATVNVNQFTGAYTVLWNTGSSNETITGLSSGVYTITVTDNNGICVTSVTIPEVQGPIASFTMSPNPATMGEDEVNFYNQSIGGNSYFWSFGDDTYAFDENPIHTYFDSGTFTVWFIVTDQNNCSDSISQNILIHDIFTFYVPNAFSPNGDGVNDYFMPFGLNMQPDNYEMLIYDRWGQLVFRTESINVPWDGRTSGTENFIEKTDVYSYVIHFRDSKGIDREMRGIVTVVF
jgi:gliding motility-associated-like protein